MQISEYFSCYTRFFMTMYKFNLSEHKNLSKIRSFFFKSIFAKFSALNIQIYTKLIRHWGSTFTLFPIYSEDKILSKYNQVGSHMKGNGM